MLGILEMGKTASENGAPVSDLYDFTAAALRTADRDLVLEWLAQIVAKATDCDEDETTAVALFRFLRVFGAHIRTLDAEAGS